jgi:hypothetical protein
MYLSPEVQSKIVEFTNKFPLANTTEESQQWTHKLCQQLKFSFPNDGWGHKSAGPGRPHSADCICLSSPFWGWDIINNAGSPQAKLNLNAESIDLSGQIFEQVTAADFIGDVPVPPDIPGTIEQKLDHIIMMLSKYHDEEMVAITAPRVTRIG